MFNGLPAHVLLVHAVVVLIPLTSVLLVLVSVWPAARRRLDVLTASLALISLASVPLTTQAGEWLEHRIPRTPLVRAHTQLGDTMLPWAIGLALLALVVLVRQRRTNRFEAVSAGEPATVEIRDSGGHHRHDQRARLMTALLGLVAVVLAVGSIVTVYRIGDSGARAAWEGQFSQQALPHSTGAPATVGTPH
jgi:hypothetical protein